MNPRLAELRRRVAGVDLRGKTVLVSGSTEGVGRQTAIELAGLGATVIVHGRDTERGEAALAQVRAAGGAAHELILADLSTAAGVDALAAAVAAGHERLDVLINNAGVYSPERLETDDGLELTFAVNALAPFRLTRALLPLLEAAASARVVNLSSTSSWQGVMHWDDLQLRGEYDPLVAYEQSKLAMSLFTFALARRLTACGITAVCLDPGNVDTQMLRAGWPELAGIDHVAGAATSVYLAAAPELAGVSGVYYERGEVTDPPEAAQSLAAQDRLWAELERLARDPRA